MFKENTTGDHHIENDTQHTEIASLANLIERADRLLFELDFFRKWLQKLKPPPNVEIDGFRSTIKSEVKMLRRLASESENEKRLHITRSSNIPFLEHLWNIVKTCKDVVCIQRRIYTSSKLKQLSQIDHSRCVPNGRKPHDQAGYVTVDAIVDGGRTWIKASLVTNQRLLFDLAKQGWVSDGSEDDECDSGGAPSQADDKFDIPMAKTAKTLANAAKCFRSRTKIPRIHMMLPRVHPGKIPEIDAILDDCERAGVTLYCGQNVPLSLDIDSAVRNMAPDPLKLFSNTLNIDCTILLALVSDFSHAKVHKEVWFHKALCRQVEIEDAENLLPSLLYPAIRGHKLVCTKEAMKRMREIVETIGTTSEKARTAILLSDDPAKSPAQLVREMQEWSAYAVPSDWNLPIRVVDTNEGDCHKYLPAEAIKAVEGQSEINRSVFLHGWATRCTTITSNRVAVKQIEGNLEKFQDLEDSIWPSIWLCPTARSLVGKEKRGPKNERK
ncbi:hypothetical protein M433DRAFT_8060 [Acidomyces richmondensis BFW]|nr:hypothetical protein M433DRAFT_8060 [Acidomyces richmondensis BFW]